jgi:predicted metal-dependent hydrolase
METRIITNPRARRLTLRLDAAGNPVVTVPRFTPKWFVNRFLNSQQEWIAKQQARFKETKPVFVTETTVHLFGKEYMLVTEETTGSSKVTAKGNSLEVAVHKGRNKTDVLNTFLKNTASHYIVPRTHQLAKKMKVEFTTITLRAQRTRWGSCSSRGSLNFNWKLVHFSPAIIDSVIIHELAHRKHLNHSKDFWQFVEQFDPEYRLHRGWLKRQGIGVG